jgi:hypothetical protein
MWVDGTTAESPAEFKRRHAQADSSDTKVVDKKSSKTNEKTPVSTGKTGWFGRLFSK